LYVFSVFSSVDFVLFWAYSGAEHATDLAALSEAGLHYSYRMIASELRAGDKPDSSHFEKATAMRTAHSCALGAYFRKWRSVRIGGFTMKEIER